MQADITTSGVGTEDKGERRRTDLCFFTMIPNCQFIVNWVMATYHADGVTRVLQCQGRLRPFYARHDRSGSSPQTCVSLSGRHLWVRRRDQAVSFQSTVEMFPFRLDRRLRIPTIPHFHFSCPVRARFAGLQDLPHHPRSPRLVLPPLPLPAVLVCRHVSSISFLNWTAY